VYSASGVQTGVNRNDSTRSVVVLADGNLTCTRPDTTVVGPFPVKAGMVLPLIAISVTSTADVLILW
jgi:hypothetical protein